jgi:hypothetical protein
MTRLVCLRILDPGDMVTDCITLLQISILRFPPFICQNSLADRRQTMASGGSAYAFCNILMLSHLHETCFYPIHDSTTCTTRVILLIKSNVRLWAHSFRAVPCSCPRDSRNSK